MTLIHFARTSFDVRRIASLLALLALCQWLLQPQSLTTEYIRGGGRVIAAIKTPSGYFTDMTGSYAPYANAADLMYADGITHGVSASTYGPATTLNRDAAAVFIIRSIFVALYGPGQGDIFRNSTLFPTYPVEMTSSAYFTDVPNSYTFFPWIQMMKYLGITSGCTSTTYCPSTAMTNDPMAVFTIRAREYVLTASATTAPPSYSSVYFADVTTTVSHFSFINAIGGLGIIQPGAFGCTPSTYFCPSNTLDREAAIPYVVYGILNDWSF